MSLVCRSRSLGKSVLFSAVPEAFKFLIQILSRKVKTLSAPFSFPKFSPQLETTNQPTPLHFIFTQLFYGSKYLVTQNLSFCRNPIQETTGSDLSNCFPTLGHELSVSPLPLETGSWMTLSPVRTGNQFQKNLELILRILFLWNHSETEFCVSKAEPLIHTHTHARKHNLLQEFDLSQLWELVKLPL